MIQDIAPHRFHNEYRPGSVPDPKSHVLCFDGKKILIKLQKEEAQENEVVYPLYSMLPEGLDMIYAFSVDDTEYFLCPHNVIPAMEGYEYIDVMKIRGFADNVYGMTAFTGYHLNQWYKDSVYCGRCGGKTIHADHERAMHCPVCGRSIYPRIMPAVIVGVIDREREKLLVTKYKEGFRYYALVAGFTEIGETLEETVAREVMEETGLKVKNIRYYKSQPWGIANDILAGYYCDADGSCEVSIDEQELKLAQWKSRSELELQPDSYSLTNEMMRTFKESSILP